MTLEYTPINLADQASYKERLARCPMITSDYSFLNIWAWQPAYGLEWAWTDDLVWLRQIRPSPVFWAPVGDWRTMDWEKSFRCFSALKEVDIIRVPEVLAHLWKSLFTDRIVISEDRNQFDYLYTASELKNLAGNRYHKKKNLVRQFEKLYDYKYISMTPDMVGRAEALQEEWCLWRNCGSEEQLAAENQAIARVFSHWEKLFGIMGGCLLVDGQMAAYTIGEQIQADTLIIHFEKGCSDFKGVYQVINQQFLNHAAQNIDWVNREQDLGDDGLRKSKESYHPARFLKKYRVRFSG